MATQETVDKNFKAFQKLEEALKISDNNRFALMRNEEVHETFDTRRDASLMAKTFFNDGEFSIQQIGIQPINLGYFSYV